jgi:hypothetical protein
MKKTAECIRQTENWSTYENHHKLDNALFDGKKVKEELDVIAPKMKKMVDHIAELDAEDMRVHGTYFKHMIFSDLKAAGGAKAIGAALLAYDFNLIYNRRLEIELSPASTSHKNFAILCSTKIYNKDVGIRFRRKIIDIYNARPTNIHGKELRFIVLDYGFKEGIDLFDVKYIHIMETPITNADHKQIIGRGTRFCGQRGLTFDKDHGWPLYVYKYTSTLPKGFTVEGKIFTKDSDKTATVFDIFSSYSNIDLVKDTFALELTKRCVQASVDYELNKSVHLYGMGPTSDFTILSDDVLENFNEDIIAMPKEIVKKYGTKLELHGPFNCIAGCTHNVMLIPTEIMLLAWYMQKDGRNASLLINNDRPRGFLCLALMRNANPSFCKKLQDIWKDPEKYIVQNKTKIEEKLAYLNEKGSLSMVRKQAQQMISYLEPYFNAEEVVPIAPSKLMGYHEMQKFVKRYYKSLKWPEVVMENLCEIAPSRKSKSKSKSKSTPTLVFTPSQKMLQIYFTPESPYKGLLVWHSTGTGKTCSGVSIASASFEKQGYTILWVTRNTLRGDIWKNMFKQVCSLSIKQPFDVDEALKNPLKYVSKNWIEPITYKQFSNLLSGRNEYYAQMVKRNGNDDPLRKTLIIIDEAHKLLSHDLKPQEKPDFNVLQKCILDSYDISKADSVKLLLMTATPYSEDPMQMIKLLNLMRPRSDQFPVDYDEFKETYLNTNGHFAEPLAFMSKVSGYISYLNRESDVRQFARPIVETIEVPISLSQSDKTKKAIDALETQIAFSLKTIDANEKKIQEAKVKLKEEKKELQDYCKKLKGKTAKDECKATIKQKEEEFKTILFAEADEIIRTHSQNVKTYKKELQALNKELTNYRETDPSQERVLKEKCLK